MSPLWRRFNSSDISTPGSVLRSAKDAVTHTPSNVHDILAYYKITLFYIHVTVHRNKFPYNKTN
jgi:hypothetical protein